MERILPARTDFTGIPYVGCAATIHVGSDSYPATVSWVSEQTVDYDYEDRKTLKSVSIKLPKRVRLRRVDSRGVEGHNNAYTENQKYVYFDDGDDSPTGREFSWRPKRKNYVEVGTSSRSSAAQAPGFGYRSYYRDPHF